MGWGDCGTDSKGRPIGYYFPAECDHPGCTAEIDRGLSYACGGMHGDDEVSCERYFCETHLSEAVEVLDTATVGRVLRICAECAKLLEAEGWRKDDEGCWVKPSDDKVTHVES